jgi:hypothetical protein
MDASSSGAIIVSRQSRGWLGVVDSITSDTVAITTGDTKRLISTDDNTQILITNKSSKLKDLEIGSRVLAIGETDQNDILTARRISTLKQLPTPSIKQTVLIQIDTVTKDLTVEAHTIPGNKPMTFLLSKKTILTQSVTNDSKLDTKALQGQPNLKAIAIYTPDTTADTNKILRLHLILPETNQ